MDFGKKIKILYYEPSSGFGGSSRCLRDWLLNLDRDRFDPVVVTLDDGPVIRELQGLGFNVVPLLKKKGPGPVFTPALVTGYLNFLIYLFVRVLPLSLKLARTIRKSRADIVHVNTPIITGLEGIFAARLTNTPVICHLHDTRRWTRFEKIFSVLVQKYICLTDEGKKLYSRYVGKNRLIRIYNGIDLQKNRYRSSSKDMKREFGIGPDNRVIGIVGRLTEGKGHATLLRASKQVLLKRPQTRIMIVGEGQTEGEMAYKKGLISLSEELGVAGHIIFTGWRNDVADLISGMDVLVQASDTFPEGFGLTCIETMALGTPLVVTNIPGPSEIVVDNETGLIVPPGDAGSMAGAILTILENGELSEKFSKNARERTERLFDLRKTVNQIEDVYLGLVQTKKT